MVGGDKIFIWWFKKSYVTLRKEIGMERICLQCKKKYDAKKESSKFCSTNCRVKWNYHNPKAKRGEVTTVQMQVLYNSVLEMVGKINTSAAPVPQGLPRMERNDANLGVSNAGLGSWLDNGANAVNEPKITVQDEYFAEFDRCQEQYEVEIVASKLKKDKRLKEWEKAPLYAYGKKIFEKL